MFESFVTAFIIYFVVIDPVGNAPIFLAVTEAQDRARKLRTALEGTAIATAIMLFFALCGAWILGLSQHHRSRLQDRRRHHPVPWSRWTCWRRNASSANATRAQVAATPAKARPNPRTAPPITTPTADDNLAIYPLAIPLLAGPSAIMSVIVVNAGFAGALASTLTGYAALLAVMVATGIILCLTVVAEGWLNEKITMVFSRITAIILAGLSVQYVIDGLTAIGILAGLKQFNLDETAGDVIAVADIMFDTRLHGNSFHRWSGC